MKYTIFYNTTGEILRVIDCDESQLNVQYNAINESYITGEYSDEQYYIENNVAVQKPTQPSYYYVFDYNTKQWVDTRTNETQLTFIREERNRRLQATDWTQLADIPQATKELWEPYRQALRDVTLQPDLFNIVWPTPPQG